VREPRVARLAFRVAVGAGALFFVVNFLTGPGAPEVDRGLPFLRDHDTLIPLSWLVYWLNLALLGTAFASGAVAFWARGRAARSPALPPPAHVLVEARFLDLSTSRLFTLPPARARIPLHRIATVRFVREWGAWTIRGEALGDPAAAFTLTPRHPRRWLAAFR
jgi:hypothetical protein